MKTTKLHTIELKATKGDKTIAKATDVFYWIDSDFKNWGTDKKEKKTPKTTLEIHEIAKNGTFAQIFSSPEKMYLSQGQIIDFCKNHKDKLRQGGYATFFPFKVEDQFFVASVLAGSDGLGANVHRFEYDGVWDADDQHRVVVPQLTIGSFEVGNLDTLTLSPSDKETLKNAVEIIKKII